MNQKIFGILIIIILISGCITQQSNKKRSFLEAKEKLSQVEVAIWYQKLVDGMQIETGRDVERVIEILKETKTDLIFRAWWRWSPCPENCEQVPESLKEKCKNNGYTYSHLGDAISKIKAKLPEIIIIGAVPAQKIDRRLWDPITGERIDYPETWDIALDPSKWGVTKISKIELQCGAAEMLGYMGDNTNCDTYDPEKATGYVPDITNPKYQELLKAFIAKQIEEGCDGIWIDGLWWNVQIMYYITEDENHPAVKQTLNASRSIIDWFHKKYPNKVIGTWSAPRTPFVSASLDFASLPSFTQQEILDLKINESLWNEKIQDARSKFGNIPLITFIDTGWGKSPMYYFSQNLSPEQQDEFLRVADEFFTKKNVIFAYPVHGGFMGKDATTLAYDKCLFYDSLAPEFGTYETIKELAQKKKGE